MYICIYIWGGETRLRVTVKSALLRKVARGKEEVPFTQTTKNENCKSEEIKLGKEEVNPTNIYHKYSIGPSIRPICTRSCLAMNDPAVQQFCGSCAARKRYHSRLQATPF